jgi:FkbM family methyltransferase
VLSPGVLRQLEDRSLVTFDGMELYVPPAAAGDVRYHFVDNADSVEEIRGLLGAARDPGGTLMDVGAMRGLLAATWVLARPGNRALAFEPSPAFAADLRQVQGMNGLGDRLELIASAVGREPGTARVGVDAMGLIDFTPGPAVERFEVPVTSVDAEVARLGLVPDAVKIDVEGDELEVLRGATGLLASRRPVLFLELHLDLLERRGVPVSEIAKLLTDNGYRFENARGKPLSPPALVGSPKAVLRVVARPAR